MTDNPILSLRPLSYRARQDEYIPPKRPYSFEAMLVNILDFAVAYLADNGRLSLWMPTANDEDVVLAIPSHHQLDLISICVQPFKKCLFRPLMLLIVLT